MGRHVVINVFTVTPEHQQELVELATKSISGTGTRQPGFVSGTVHRSSDGVRVANVIEWESEEAWHRAHAANRGVNPEFDAHMARVHEISQPDPHIYEVAFSTSTQAGAVAG